MLIWVESVKINDCQVFHKNPIGIPTREVFSCCSATKKCVDYEQEVDNKCEVE